MKLIKSGESVSLKPLYVMPLFEQTCEVISTKTLTFIGIIGSCIEYKIFITTDAILATKWSWTTFTAWISFTYRRWRLRNWITFKVESSDFSTSLILGFAKLVTAT